MQTKPWVKTSLAPGSRVVTDYLDQRGPHALPREARVRARRLRVHDVHRELRAACRTRSATAVDDGDLNVVAVLSGNRNFEGRIHPQVRASYLGSPPLCVAYALAGRVDIDLTTEPIGDGADGPVYLADIWPSPEEVAETIRTSTDRGQFETEYGRIWDGDEHWASLPVADGTDVRLGPRVDVRAGAAVLRGARRRRRRREHRGRARPGEGRRLAHDRPHLAGRIDQGRLTRGGVPQGARRRAGRVQQLRSAPRQPRGDDARDVREHPDPQRDGARHRGAVDHVPARRRRHDRVRRRGPLPGGRRSARGAGGQGVRHRLQPRLGGEGSVAPRACGS